MKASLNLAFSYDNEIISCHNCFFFGSNYALINYILRSNLVPTWISIEMYTKYKPHSWESSQVTQYTFRKTLFLQSK